jgi:hypothetical protein
MDDRELRKAIRRDDLPRLKLLVEGGASIAVPGRISLPTLGYAASFDRLDMVKWLVQEFGALVSEVDVY